MLDKHQLVALERPQALCAECDRALGDLERNPTRLRSAEPAPQRADFCPDCWEFAKEEAYDSYWLTRRVKKEKRMPKLSRKEKGLAARVLFESLWDRREEEHLEPHLYFLAHLLLRWGALKWLRSEQDSEGREIIFFENPATGDELDVPAIDPTDEAIVNIRERIEAFLREQAPDMEVAVE